MDSLMSSAISAVGTGAFVLIVARVWLNGLLQDVRDARSEVKSLREEKIVVLEGRMTKAEDNCKAHQQGTEIATLTTLVDVNGHTLARIESKIDTFASQVARVEEKSAANEKGIRDQWSEVNRIKDALRKV